MGISQVAAEKFVYQGLLEIKNETVRVLNQYGTLSVVDFVCQSLDLLSLFMDQIITESCKKLSIAGDALQIRSVIRKCACFAQMMDQFCVIASRSSILVFVRNLNGNIMKAGLQIRD